MKPFISLIIPAAGTSKRFQRSYGKPLDSKLLLPLNGQTVLSYTLNAFSRISQVREIIIATNPLFKRKIQSLVLPHLQLTCPVRLVKGGQTRAASVWQALKHVSKHATHVMIHDGARPQVKSVWIQQLIQKITQADGVILGKTVVPTVKRIDQKKLNILETLDRRELFEAETPQLFKKQVLLKAYRQLKQKALTVTDDASLVEMLGGTVTVVPHDGFNIKVTTAEDLNLVRQQMAHASSAIVFGLGFDRHRLTAGRPFYLGGVKIKAPFGPVGHSDGDPLLHAVIDGMLGALGLGDIGDFFSDQDKRYRNIASSVLAKKALAMIQSKGFRVALIDTTIFLEQPKLKENKQKIKMRISKLFNVPNHRVGVKAKTAEGLGPEGRSEAVSAQALVVLQKAAQ